MTRAQQGDLDWRLSANEDMDFTGEPLTWEEYNAHRDMEARCLYDLILPMAQMWVDEAAEAIRCLARTLAPLARILLPTEERGSGNMQTNGWYSGAYANQTDISADRDRTATAIASTDWDDAKPVPEPGPDPGEPWWGTLPPRDTRRRSQVSRVWRWSPEYGRR